MSIFYIRDVQQTAEQIANLTHNALFDINIPPLYRMFLYSIPYEHVKKIAAIKNHIYGL